MGFITLSDGRKVMMKQNHYPDSDKKEFWQDLPKDERERLLNKTHISPQDAKELSKKHWKTVSNSHANSGASNVQGFVNYVRSVYNKQDFQREKYEHANRHMK